MLLSITELTSLKGAKAQQALERSWNANYHQSKTRKISAHKWRLVFPFFRPFLAPSRLCVRSFYIFPIITTELIPSIPNELLRI
jgi:hypothetical protein